jgi:hypothetical protein
MKKFLYALVAACLTFGMVGLAEAGMNKQERANGNAQWVQSATGNTYQIGRTILHVRITDVSTASSEYVYIPETGVLTEVHCTISAAITGADATIAVAASLTGDAATTLTITQSGSAIGDIDSSTGLSAAVTAGGVLVIGTNGQSSTTSVGNCLAFIDPVAQ